MVEIRYNGVALANLEADQSAILECTNQKMLGPVIVTVPALTYYDGSVTITGGVELISFTIAGTTYQAESGMTWAEWVDSEYNTSGYGIDNDYICPQGTPLSGWVRYNGVRVIYTETIVNGREYVIEPFQSGGA